MTTLELATYVAPFLGTARTIAATANTKPAPAKPRSRRTYYLGNTGRVSQRSKLVGGTIVALTRATNTAEALANFRAEVDKGCCYAAYLNGYPRVGETVEQKQDRITRNYTAFKTFNEMVEDTFPTYRPSLDMRYKALRWLADRYDEAQYRRGDKRVAYRFGWPAYCAQCNTGCGTDHYRKARNFAQRSGYLCRVCACWDMNPDSVQMGRSE